MRDKTTNHIQERKGQCAECRWIKCNTSACRCPHCCDNLGVASPEYKRFWTKYRERMSDRRYP